MTPADNIGYDDTPMIPGTEWHVHDGKRPQPPVVTPGTPSLQDEAGEAPSDAVLLFDGTDLSGWEKVGGGDAEWNVQDGYMQVNPGTGSIQTKEQFGDCQLHVEWAPPAEIHGESQGRGNSGVFMMGRYEVQVLDCYDNPTYPDGTTGAMYGQMPPLVNACRKPGEWQVYDIIWEVPLFDGAEVVKKACVTVLLNGVALQHRTELIGGTTHQKVGEYTPHDPVGPLQLQDHGDLVRFRNIWYRPLGLELQQ